MIPGYIDEINADKKNGVERTEDERLEAIEKKRIDRILRQRRRVRREREMDWNDRYDRDYGRNRYY